MEKQEWFATWFDTEYYHKLYKNRDDKEAAVFVSNLVNFLKPTPKSLFADLACGKGRHSVFLNNMGFEVCGYDLSEYSIIEAKKHENEKLSFYVHDMRQPFGANMFEYVFNLFTSFGYFKNEAENLKVLKNIHQALKPGGKLVVDFLNAEFILAHQINCTETKVIDGLTYKLTKVIENNFIVKKINIVEENLFFEERVQLISAAQFKVMFEKAGFKILHQFGDYNLNAVDANSTRLISIVSK